MQECINYWVRNFFSVQSRVLVKNSEYTLNVQCRYMCDSPENFPQFGHKNDEKKILWHTSAISYLVFYRLHNTRTIFGTEKNDLVTQF